MPFRDRLPKNTIVALAVILGAAASHDAFSGCTKDTECKGDRICVNGVCVDPAGEKPRLGSVSSGQPTAPQPVHEQPAQPKPVNPIPAQPAASPGTIRQPPAQKPAAQQAQPQALTVPKPPAQQVPAHMQPAVQQVPAGEQVVQPPVRQEQPAGTPAQQQSEAQQPQGSQNAERQASPLTEIGGDIRAIAFTREKGPFLVKQDLVVPESATVVFEPGCVLLFREFTGLNIFGKVIVKGTEKSPVVFTSEKDSAFSRQSGAAAAPFDWNGIKLHPGSKGSSFGSLRLFYSTYGLYSIGGDLTLDKCVFGKNGQNNAIIAGKLQVAVDGMPYSYPLVAESSPKKIPRQWPERSMSLEVFGSMGFLFNMLNPDPRAALESFANTYPSPKLFVTPAKPDFGFGSRFSYRLSRRFSCSGLLEYAPQHPCSTFISAFLNTDMNSFWTYSTTARVSLINAGLGIAYDFINKERTGFGVSVTGKMGKTRYRMNEDASWMYRRSLASDPDTFYFNKNNADLGGLTFGFNAGFNYRFKLTPRISVCADVLFDCLLSAMIDGSGHETRRMILYWDSETFTDSLLTDKDHTYAIMKTTLPGGGEYFDFFKDPDDPQTNASRSLKEFTGVRLRLGFAYWF